MITDYLPVAFFDVPILNSIVYLLGELVIIVLVLWILLSLLIGILIALSIRKKKMYFPMLLRPVLALTEGTVKLVCMMFRVDPTELMEFLIKIDNQMNYSAFAKVPVERRAVLFLSVFALQSVLQGFLLMLEFPVFHVVSVSLEMRFQS